MLEESRLMKNKKRNKKFILSMRMEKGHSVQQEGYCRSGNIFLQKVPKRIKTYNASHLQALASCGRPATFLNIAHNFPHFFKIP